MAVLLPELVMVTSVPNSPVAPVNFKIFVFESQPAIVAEILVEPSEPVADTVLPVSYTHLTLPTTPYV